jgi:uncharacterized protein YndB with AHSA1/START domain
MENRNSSTADRGLLLTRTLNAPVELVWEVWSKPEHIAKWWGPTGFTNTISVMDLQPGGKWNLIMHGPDGTDYGNESTFVEVVQHKRIVYEHTTWPHIIATIDFEDLGEQTGLTWHMLFDSVEDFIEVAKKHQAKKGQKENVDKLEAYLEGMK